MLALGLLVLPAGLQANPGGSWSFDGGTVGQDVTQADDGSGNGNHAVQAVAGTNLNNIPADRAPAAPGLPTYAAGIVGDTAASFDGTQGLEVPDGAAIYDFRTDNTKMAWIQCDEGKGGTIWQTAFRPHRHNPAVSFNFGVTTKGIQLTVDGGVIEQRAGRAFGTLFPGEGLRLDDGTPHHIAYTEEPQKEIDILVPADCNGDAVIDAGDDADMDGENDCPTTEQDNVDLATGFIDGVQIEQGTAIEARRSKALGQLWFGLGTRGAVYGFDCNGDGVTDGNDLDPDTGLPCERQDGQFPFNEDEVGMEGIIDEMKFFRGALTADEITDEAEGNPPDCTGKANTTVTGVSLIDSPAHGETGVYTFQASGASDPENDDILYFFRGIRTAGDPYQEDDLIYVTNQGPSDNDTFAAFLPAGTWEMEVTVDDSVRCPAAVDAGGGGNHIANSAAIVVAPFTGFPEFRQGSEGGTNQIYYDFSKWFDRSPDDNTYWTTVTGSNSAVGGDYTFRTQGGGGRLTFLFDVSVVGGGAGTWHLWTRMINPQNSSDFGSIEGDPDDILDLNVTPAGPPWPGRGSQHPLGAHTFTNDDRVFEFNAGPTYVWSLRSITVGDGSGGTEGHIKELRDGLNQHFFHNRQGAPVQKVDVMCWTDDTFFTASDASLRAAVDLASPAPVFFSRGDGNGDGKVNIADPSFIANFVFGIAPATTPACVDAADSNGDGGVNIADVSFTANFVFGVAPATAPPAPGPNCGTIAAADVIDCDTVPAACQ
jgi:hypothetical protein